MSFGRIGARAALVPVVCGAGLLAGAGDALAETKILHLHRTVGITAGHYLMVQINTTSTATTWRVSFRY